MAEQNINFNKVPPGPLLSYYADIASGAIRPEDVRIEMLPFRAFVDAIGVVTVLTSKISVVSRYNFVLREVRATISNPDLAGSAPELVRVNVKEQGRSFSVFKQPIPMSLFQNYPAQFDGAYICVPGTDLEVEWSVDTSLWTALVGVTKYFSVGLLGDYIACGPTQRS